jgi:hypothetical protein
MSDLGPRRLIRALSSTESDLDHAACQARLAEYLAIELADEDPARAFPEVQAHLDRCEACSELHALMLDEALALETGTALPEAPVPEFTWPWPIRVRQWVQTIAQATLADLRQGQSEVEGAADAFFEALAQASAPLTLRDSAVAFGLGTSRSEALPLVMTIYYGLDSYLGESRPLDLTRIAPTDEARGQWILSLRREAARVGLGAPATAALVQAALRATQNPSGPS